jgi:mannitol/fructose-specific phosphotransferase system IIA component (Ntr-type)
MSGQVASPSRVRARFSARDVDAALAEIAELLSATSASGLAPSEFLHGLTQREAITPTNIGSGIAMPHFIDHRLRSADVVAITLSSPIKWGPAIEPVDIVFGLSGTPTEPWRHIRSLAHLARLAAIPGFADRLRTATDDDALGRIFAEEAARHG